MSQSLTSTCDDLFVLADRGSDRPGRRLDQCGDPFSVLTNASTGYTLSASDSGLSRSSPAYTIPDITSGPGTGVGTFPVQRVRLFGHLHDRRHRRRRPGCRAHG